MRALDAAVRVMAGALGAGLGLGLARWLLAQGVLESPLNLFYLALLGLLLGALLSPLLLRAARRLARVPPDAARAAAAGAALALLLAVLLSGALERVPGFSWPLSLLLTLLLVAAASWGAVRYRRRLPFVRAMRAAPRGGSVLDTSALIDGRVAEVAAAGFVSGPLLLPRTVLLELQAIADSPDPQRRKRGREGLAVVERLRAQPGVSLSVISDAPEAPSAAPVDEQLVQLCAARGAALLTTDFNLGRVAAAQGVRVLNLHALALALKPRLLPGEPLRLTITKAGREPGQGVGYLGDGTLVVVADAAHLIGQEATALVTSHLQTGVGRMVFAKLEAAPSQSLAHRA